MLPYKRRRVQGVDALNLDEAMGVIPEIGDAPAGAATAVGNYVVNSRDRTVPLDSTPTKFEVNAQPTKRAISIIELMEGTLRNCWYNITETYGRTLKFQYSLYDTTTFTSTVTGFTADFAPGYYTAITLIQGVSSLVDFFLNTAIPTYTPGDFQMTLDVQSGRVIATWNAAIALPNTQVQSLRFGDDTSVVLPPTSLTTFPPFPASSLTPEATRITTMLGISGVTTTTSVTTFGTDWVLISGRDINHTDPAFGPVEFDNCVDASLPFSTLQLNLDPTPNAAFATGGSSSTFIFPIGDSKFGSRVEYRQQLGFTNKVYCQEGAYQLTTLEVTLLDGNGKELVGGGEDWSFTIAVTSYEPN